MINKNYSLRLKKSKGITLATLIITVTVLLIIAGISVASGVETASKTKLKAFYTNLSIIQKRVDEINSTNESYSTTVNNVETTVDLKNAGEELTQDQKTLVNNILTENSITDISVDDFRYFSKENLYEQLDIHDIDYNVFIHSESRTIIAEEGIKVNGITYYMLEDSSYQIENNSSKNRGTLSLTYSTPTEYGTNKYKVKVTQNQIGDLGIGGTLKYKKTTSNYWTTADNFEMILEKDVNYDIIYTDLNNNEKEDEIIVQLINDNIVVNSVK